jgi:hypothetical protein
MTLEEVRLCRRVCPDGFGLCCRLWNGALLVISPLTRRTFAFQSFLGGPGLGPVFIARLIGSLGGRTPAFNVGVLGWLICGVMNLAMFFTVSADEASVQRRLTANLSANSQ